MQLSEKVKVILYKFGNFNSISLSSKWSFSSCLWHETIFYFSVVFITLGNWQLAPENIIALIYNFLIPNDSRKIVRYLTEKKKIPGAKWAKQKSITNLKILFSA